jgi:hypothetical protein
MPWVRSNVHRTCDGPLAHFLIRTELPTSAVLVPALLQRLHRIEAGASAAASFLEPTPRARAVPVPLGPVHACDYSPMRDGTSARSKRGNAMSNSRRHRALANDVPMQRNEWAASLPLRHEQSGASSRAIDAPGRWSIRFSRRRTHRPRGIAVGSCHVPEVTKAAPRQARLQTVDAEDANLLSCRARSLMMTAARSAGFVLEQARCLVAEISPCIALLRSSACAVEG